MSIQSTVFEETKEILHEMLSRGFVTMDVFGERVMGSDLRISNFSIDAHEGKHAKVTIMYTKTSPLATARMETGTLTLVVFNSPELSYTDNGGRRPAFKNRLFKGNPPYTIALDVFRRNLYLVYLVENGIRISLFRELSEEDVRLVIEEASLEKPYSLRIPSEVLMDMISGDEGYNHAYRNLQVVFNCSVPIVFNNGLVME